MHFDRTFINERITTKFKNNLEIRESIRKNMTKKLFNIFVTRVEKQISQIIHLSNI